MYDHCCSMARSLGMNSGNYPKIELVSRNYPGQNDMLFEKSNL